MPRSRAAPGSTEGASARCRARAHFGRGLSRVRISAVRAPRRPLRKGAAATGARPAARRCRGNRGASAPVSGRAPVEAASRSPGRCRTPRARSSPEVRRLRGTGLVVSRVRGRDCVHSCGPASQVRCVRRAAVPSRAAPRGGVLDVAYVRCGPAAPPTRLPPLSATCRSGATGAGTRRDRRRTGARSHGMRTARARASSPPGAPGTLRPRGCLPRPPPPRTAPDPGARAARWTWTATRTARTQPAGGVCQCADGRAPPRSGDC